MNFNSSRLERDLYSRKDKEGIEIREWLKADIRLVWSWTFNIFFSGTESPWSCWDLRSDFETFSLCDHIFTNTWPNIFYLQGGNGRNRNVPTKTRSHRHLEECLLCWRNSHSQANIRYIFVLNLYSTQNYVRHRKQAYIIDCWPVWCTPCARNFPMVKSSIVYWISPKPQTHPLWW